MKLVSFVFGLLGWDIDGYCYGVYMEVVKDFGCSKELEVGNSFGNVFLSIVSIERVGFLVKVEESIRLCVVIEKFCGYI